MTFQKGRARHEEVADDPDQEQDAEEGIHPAIVPAAEPSPPLPGWFGA
jgi:hypothetical protein